MGRRGNLIPVRRLRRKMVGFGILYQRVLIEIATPVCALVRNDMVIDRHSVDFDCGQRR